MKYSAEQVINGIMQYADAEVIGKLPGAGKWVVGAAMYLASDRVKEIVDSLSTNPIVIMMGLIDEDNNIDADALMNAFKSAADKYGKLSLDVPLIGKMTFSASDIDALRRYMQ